MSDGSITRVNEFSNVILYPIEIITQMHTYLESQGMSSFASLDEKRLPFASLEERESSFNMKEINEAFDIDISDEMSGDQIPIYFDHTIAASTSSYPSIYLQGIIPGTPPRYIGPLVNKPPDKAIRVRVYLKYFQNLLPPPMALSPDREILQDKL
jgi:hypothetical protein